MNNIYIKSFGIIALTIASALSSNAELTIKYDGHIDQSVQERVEQKAAKVAQSAPDADVYIMVSRDGNNCGVEINYEDSSSGSFVTKNTLRSRSLSSDSQIPGFVATTLDRLLNQTSNAAYTDDRFEQIDSFYVGDDSFEMLEL